MPEIWINGRQVQASGQGTLLSALQNSGVLVLRRSLSGEPRGALCGMGSCLECRVRVNGQQVRACMTPVEAGQRIELLYSLEHDHD